MKAYLAAERIVTGVTEQLNKSPLQSVVYITIQELSENDSRLRADIIHILDNHGFTLEPTARYYRDLQVYGIRKKLAQEGVVDLAAYRYKKKSSSGPVSASEAVTDRQSRNADIINALRNKTYPYNRS